ncbi:MAG: CopG family transcriptional regulator [Pseudomonadota bacterium]
MKSVTIRLPDSLAEDIEAEARRRKVSKTDVMRERLGRNMDTAKMPPSLDAIADLIGSIDSLPADLSRNKKAYLKAGYGKKRTR